MSPFNTKPNTTNVLFLCVGALEAIAMQRVLDYVLGTVICNFIITTISVRYICLFVCFCGRLLSKELGIPIGILPTSGAGVDGNAPYQDNPGIQTNFLPPRPVQS